jgi:hypothetical protein
MIEILEFIFQDFWHWVGSIVILISVASVLGGITSAIAALFK